MTKAPNKPPAAPAAPLKPTKAPAKAAPEFKGLCDIIDGIMKETGNEELTAVDRPVPTGLDLLDFYNGRYFRTPDGKGWSLAVGAPEGKMIGLVGYTGTGKSHPLDTILQTPTGPRCIGSLAVGDLVFGRDGRPTAVTGVFPRGVLPVYRVRFRDGTSVRCGADHLWKVRYATKKDTWNVLTTAQLVERGLKRNPGSGSYKYSIPLCDPVQYPKAELAFDPYTVGALIGDGSLTGNGPVLSCSDADADILERVRGTLSADYRLKRHGTGGSCPQYYISDAASDGPRAPNRLMAEIRRLELDVLSAHKRIPKEYLRSCVEDRVALLQGLMDTDGTSSGNRVRFSTTSPQLAEDVKELVQSLGGVAIVAKYDRDEIRAVEWEVRVRVTFNPFHCARKAAGWRASTKNPPVRYISGIEEEGAAEEQVCISVAAEDHLYLTEGFAATHNTTEAVQMGIAICLPYEGAMVYHFDLERAWSKERTAEICGMTMAETDRRYKRLKKAPLERIMAFTLNIHLTKIKEGKSNPAMWVVDVETGVRKLIPTVVLIDTVDALDSEIDEEALKAGSALAEAGAQAKANNRAAKRLSGIIGESNITVIWVNHIREKIQTGNTPEAKRIQHIGAKETIPGGHGFPQQSDLLLKLTPVGGALDMGEKMKIPGKVVRHIVVKTRLSYDGRAYNLILTKEGFDNDWSNLAFLASEKLLKGASSYLYLEHNGLQTRKFAMSQYKELVTTDANFREVANGVLLDALTALVPTPGSMEEADVIAAGRALIEAEGISLEEEAADLAAD
jgi:hypothetical protein